MRNLKLFVLILALGFGTAMSAKTANSNFTEPNAVDAEVHKILQHHEFSLKEDVSLEVILTVNKDKELVVLSVDSKNYNLKKFILERLNYKKVEGDVDLSVREYKIPVTIKA